MLRSSLNRRSISSGLTASLLLVAAAALILAPRQVLAQSSGGPTHGASRVMLPGSVPSVVARSTVVGSLQPDAGLQISIVLPLRNTAALQALLKDLYDPKSASYGHFLTPAEFTAQFGPTQEDYDKVIAFAQASGLSVVRTNPGRTLLNVKGSAATIGRTFGVNLKNYRNAATGEVFYAPDSEPSIPAALDNVVSGVVGLHNAGKRRSFARLLPKQEKGTIGTGVNGGLTPKDIKAAYGLTSVTQDGTGQTLGLFELDDYRDADVSGYESAFALPAVPLQRVLVDNGVSFGDNADEVTLDIELQMALAPKVSKIYVYEAPDTDQGAVDTYARIAADNLAGAVSASWGLEEEAIAPSSIAAENAAFVQMAAQGQSIFASAGDSGAFDDGSTLSVDDPASQPYVTGVGGTHLITASRGGAYVWEQTWGYWTYDSSGDVIPEGGGGGISSLWTIPSYQVGAFTAASNPQGSLTMRNVPDVALNADPQTGYAIYFDGAFYTYGGTSCSAPLWAAFTALVNQKRATAAEGPLGFANPAIYSVAKVATTYATGFHDVKDGTDNLFYNSGIGYDNATGWGSFLGSGLISSLTTFAPVPTLVSFSPTSGKAATSVKLTGVNLNGATAVKFGSVAATFTTVSPTTITTSVPATAITAPISVTTKGGTSTSASSFVVFPLPTVASFTPTTGAPGTQVTITGTNFSSTNNTASTITFNGTPSTAFTVSSVTQILATVPAGATTGKIAVTTNGGTATSSASFTVTTAALSSLAFNPATVSPGGSSTGTVTLSALAPAAGATVAITLNGFPYTTVTVPVGGTSAPFSVATASSTPTGAYTFSATYNGVTKTATLTVAQAVTISSLAFNPSTVKKGASTTGTVTLAAAAPLGGVTVSITQGGFPVASATIAAGSTTGTFSLPTATTTTAGPYTFVASYGNSSASAILTVTN